MNADREVVAHALRHYGYSPDVVETLIDRIAEQPADEAAEETGTRCPAYRTVTRRGAQLVYRCNLEDGHTGDHDAGNGVTWLISDYLGDKKPANPTHTKTGYAVEQRYGDAWMQRDAPNPTIHDARDEWDAAAETTPRDQLRIVRVTETREVVE